MIVSVSLLRVHSNVSMSTCITPCYFLLRSSNVCIPSDIVAAPKRRSQLATHNLNSFSNVSIISSSLHFSFRSLRIATCARSDARCRAQNMGATGCVQSRLFSSSHLYRIGNRITCRADTAWVPCQGQMSAGTPFVLRLPIPNTTTRRATPPRADLCSGTGIGSTSKTSFSTPEAVPFPPSRA